MNSEIKFNLNNKISYQNSGENIQSNELVLYAPSYKTRKHTNKLKQLFFRATKSVQSNSNSGNNQGQDDIKSDDLILMFYASDVDIEEVFTAFDEVLLSGHCKIDGVENLKRHHLDSIDSEDVEKMLGVYLLDFLLSSWMSKLTNNS